MERGSTLGADEVQLLECLLYGGLLGVRGGGAGAGDLFYPTFDGLRLELCFQGRCGNLRGGLIPHHLDIPRVF